MKIFGYLNDLLTNVTNYLENIGFKLENKTEPKYWESENNNSKYKKPNHKCSDKTIIPVVDNGIYLYSICTVCEQAYDDLKKQLVYNISLGEKDNPKLEKYIEIRGPHWNNTRRRDLERSCYGK